MSDEFTIGTEYTVIITGGSAKEYRLGRLGNGELVLQGAFEWRSSDNKSGGIEWTTLPTVDLNL